jgi:type VI secretion system protein ImpJ
MLAVMRQIQPVLWTKGVLLSPQHLQTQDRFVEDVLHFELTALTFAPWGFQRLELDREALASGRLAITAASGVFPDGLLFDMPLSDPLPSPKPLGELWGQDQKTLDVYLAVPEYRYGGINVSGGSSRDAGTRYRAEELRRRDENTGEAERPIQVARKNVRFLAQGESLDGNALLPVARITRSAAGVMQADPTFIPPLVDISASETVMTIARRLIEIVAAKSSELSGGRRQRNQSLADFTVTDVASFWLLYTLNSYFPELRHIYETRRGHPAVLYEAMLRLAGALTTFSSTIQPRALPTYDHDDLTRCFATLDVTVRTLLDTVVPANTVSIPLRQTRPFIYAASLDQDRYLQATQAYLAISSSSGGRPVEVEQRSHLLKVCAAPDLEHLIRQALAGIPMTFVPTPPAAVPVKVDHRYFLLQRSGPEWQAVVRSREIAAYVPAEFPDPQIEIVLVLPPKA